LNQRFKRQNDTRLFTQSALSGPRYFGVTLLTYWFV
jgi:hypothetical protein